MKEADERKKERLAQRAQEKEDEDYEEEEEEAEEEEEDDIEVVLAEEFEVGGCLVHLCYLSFQCFCLSPLRVQNT